MTPAVGVTQTNSLDVKNLKEGIMPNSTTASPTTYLEEMNEMYSNTVKTAVEGLNTEMESAVVGKPFDDWKGIIGRLETIS